MLTLIRSFRLLLAMSAPLFFMANTFADDLAARVTSQIEASPDLKGASISVKALGPTVWLSGAATIEEQQAALAVAKKTSGVERVVDQLSVSQRVPRGENAGESSRRMLRPGGLVGGMQKPGVQSLGMRHVVNQPVGISDLGKDELAQSVAHSLRNSGMLKGYRVSVKAKSGTVWLEGTLASLDQLQTAVAIAEQTRGVERVVNRLSVDTEAPSEKSPNSQSLFSLPDSMLNLIGMGTPPNQMSESSLRELSRDPVQLANAELPSSDPAGIIQLTQGQEAVSQAQYPSRKQESLQTQRSPQFRQTLSAQEGRPLPMRMAARMNRAGIRPTGYGEPMVLPGPQEYADYGGSVRVVPGSMKISEGSQAMPQASMLPTPAASSSPGQPVPMGATGVGMPAVPVRGGGPNMPNYAWPSYAANPNYAALQYPTQYSPTAWPYIGPFYPYPQVPLGWRRVSLEWDDGWWYVDFDDRHVHSHHR
ncbi:MAG: BON domain-containing protein [Pirellulales bacterium]